MLVFFALPVAKSFSLNKFRFNGKKEYHYIIKINTMLEQLLDVIKQNAGEAIINNSAIPNDKNNAVIHEIGSSLAKGLSQAVASGNLQDIAGLLKNGSNVSALASNPLVNNIISGVVKQVSEKFNLPASTVQSIATSLIPTVLSQFSKKVNDPNDKSIDLNSVITALGGKGGFDIAGLAGQILGGGGKSKGGLLGGLLGKFIGK